MADRSVIIIGAGISGLLSAYYLARAGRKVTILESQPAPALAASGANGAQLSYSYVPPIGSPALLRSLPSLLLGSDPARQVRCWSPAFIRWALALLQQSTQRNYQDNQQTLLQLSLRSRNLLESMQEQCNFDFNYQIKGKLQLFNNKELYNSAKHWADHLCAHYAILQQLWNPEECAARLPRQFTMGADVIGGVYSSIDASGDAQQFCVELLKYLQAEYEVECHFNSPISAWELKDGRVRQVESEQQSFEADDFLLCTGALSDKLLQKAGLGVPVYPIKGYSLTYPAGDIALPFSITDHSKRIVVAQLGEYIRVSGMFLFAGWDTSVEDRDVRYLRESVRQLLPALADVEPEIRVGLRPCTPSSLPIVKAMDIPNLYVNTGQGMLGWTLAHACADNIAKIMTK